MHLSSPEDLAALKRGVGEILEKYAASPTLIGNGVVNKEGEPIAVVVICHPQAHAFGEMIHTMLQHLPGMEDAHHGELTFPLKPDPDPPFPSRN